VAPHDATVRRLLVAEGEQVAAGTELVELDD
jgi:biotin carboxyl carrier protein